VENSREELEKSEETDKFGWGAGWIARDRPGFAAKILKNPQADSGD